MESCLITCHIVNTISLVIPTALILNIKREAINLPILYIWLCFMSVCAGQGEGHLSAWLNVSMQQSLANHRCLSCCANMRRPRSRTVCREDSFGWYSASLHAYVMCTCKLRHSWTHGCMLGKLVEFLKNAINIQRANYMFLFRLWGSERGVKNHDEMDLLTSLLEQFFLNN